MVKKSVNSKVNVPTTRICIFSWSPIWSMLHEVSNPWRHYCKKSAKRRVFSWMFGWWVWFFTHWSAATTPVQKDEADSCHSWPQYNALLGRVKGRYLFRYPNKVQLRFRLIQIIFWKPKYREIDVPQLWEMSCRQPAHVYLEFQVWFIPKW